MTGVGVATLSVFAVVLSAGGTAVALQVLHRLQILDVPNARSTHEQPVVRGAGVGPLVAALVALVVAAVTAETGWISVIALAGGAALLGALGFADDLRGGLPIRTRLGGQLAVGLLAGVLIVDDRGAAGIALALACAVWVASSVNAFNFMDGINGITGVSAAVIGGAFAVLGAFESTSTLVLASGVIVACVAIGFLPFNFPIARAFLGDVGSYFFGGWCAVMAVLALEAGVPLDAVALPFGLYLADTGTVLLKRAKGGQPLGTPHRQHVYQRLVDGGVSVEKVAVYVGVTTAALAGLGMIPFMAGGGRLATVPLATLVLAGYLASPRLFIQAKELHR